MLQFLWILMSIFYSYNIKQKIVESWYSEKNLASFGREEENQHKDFFSRMLNKSITKINGVTEFFYLLSTRIIALALKITNTIYVFLKIHTLFTFQVLSPY